jgi:phenylpropionate dioxygenase-like ring-hydroxylating dioxygenase large terminal subunit
MTETVNPKATSAPETGRPVRPAPAGGVRKHRAGKLPGRQDWSTWPHYQAAVAGFRGYWYPVCFSSQVGEKPRAVTLLGERLLVIRDKGKVYGMKDRCPHRGVPLSFGDKQFPGAISCVYHGWTFDLETGDLKAAITDGPQSPICGKVTQPTYDVEERLGMVWVYVGDGEKPHPIDEQLPEELVGNAAVLGQRIQPREGNWRFACENGYDEGHAKYLHRTSLWRLFKPMPVEHHEDRQARSVDLPGAAGAVLGCRLPRSRQVVGDRLVQGTSAEGHQERRKHRDAPQGPNHFRGFWLDLIPAWTMGVGEVIAAGEAGTPKGPQKTDPVFAHALASHLVEAGTEVAISARLQLDHGQSHAIQYLLNGLEIPVVPLVVNVFAQPLPTLARCVQLGENLAAAIEAAAGGRRVVVIASGGLSHQLPWPSDWTQPDGDDEAFLVEAWLNGRGEWERYDPRRREIIVAARPTIFEDFDRTFLDDLEHGRLERYTSMTTSKACREDDERQSDGRTACRSGLFVDATSVRRPADSSSRYKLNPTEPVLDWRAAEWLPVYIYYWALSVALPTRKIEDMVNQVVLPEEEQLGYLPMH